MCIWSKECINLKEGFEIQEDGSMKPRKLGDWVLSIECAEMILNARRHNSK